MKVLVITNLYPPQIIGGAEIYAEMLAKGLASTGFNVVVVTSTKGRRYFEERAGIPIYRIAPQQLFQMTTRSSTSRPRKLIGRFIDIWNPITFRIVSEILRIEKPDIVHTNNLLGLSASVWHACRRHDIPIVHTLHDFWLCCPRGLLLRAGNDICAGGGVLPCKVYRSISRELVKNLDCIIAPSKFIAEMHQRWRILCKHRVIVHPNPVPASSVAPAFNRLSQSDRLRLLYLGQLAPHKGLHVLLDAIEPLIRRGAGVTLDIVGNSNNEYARSLRSRFEKVEGIRFHGVAGQTVKERFLERTDILVVPSLCFENCPMVVLEAFQYSMPVICSRIGGLPEMVIHGENGFLFEPGNANDLRQRIDELLNRPDLVNAMAASAGQRALHHALNKYIERLTEIYRMLI